MNYENDPKRFDRAFIHRNFNSKGRDKDSIRARMDERLSQQIEKQKQSMSKVTPIKRNRGCW